VNGGKCHPFLTLAVNGGSDHHHILASLLLDKGWISAKAGLDAVEKGKIAPLLRIVPDSLSSNPQSGHYIE
jgi:hypothetical protein